MPLAGEAFAIMVAGMTDIPLGIRSTVISAAVALALAAVPGRATHAATPAPPSTLVSPGMPLAASGPSVDGSFQVTITLDANLAGLDPSAVSGTWLCSARALSKPAVDAEIAKLAGLTGPSARWEYSSALEYRAHYLGQQTSVGFAIASGGYSSRQSITIKVLRDDLVDTVTKRLIEQPAVMVGCWLSLTNAMGQTAVAYQVKKPTAGSNPLVAMAQVPAPPYFVASAIVPSE